MPQAKSNPGRNIAVLYLLLTFTWPVVKLLGLATSSWWRVTSLLWGPWLLLLVVAIIGLLFRKRTEPS